MRKTVRRFATDDSGASLVEYSLLIGLLSIAIVLSITAISSDMAIIWSTLASVMASAA